MVEDESFLLLDHDQLVLEILIKLFGVDLVFEGKRMMNGLTLSLICTGNENAI